MRSYRSMAPIMRPRAPPGPGRGQGPGPAGSCSGAAAPAPCAPARPTQPGPARRQPHRNRKRTGHAPPLGASPRQREAGMALWLTLAILAGAIALFVTEKLRVDVVALLVMTALMVSGVITVPEALSGFSSQATVMVAAMFVLS